MSAVAKVILSADDRTAGPLSSAARNVERLGISIDKLRSSALAGFAALGGGAAFVAAIRNSANLADEMGKTAQRAGVTTEAFTALKYAADLSDVSSDELAKGLRRLSAEVADGGDKLRALGINLLDSAGKAKTSDQLFGEVADRFAAMPSGIDKTTLAVTLFGEKLGPQLIPLLSSGSAGLKDMGDEAQRLGRVITDDAAASAATFNDNLARLSMGVQGITQKMAGPLIESLAFTSSYFIKVANDVGIARAALITYGGAVARTLGLDEVGKLQSEARANANALALTVKQIETFQGFADRGDSAAAARVSALREQYARLQTDGQRITDALKGQAKEIEDAFKPVVGSPLVAPELPDLDPNKPRNNLPKMPGGDPLGEFIAPRLQRINDLEREAAQIYKETRTPIEQLTQLEANLLKLKESGYLADDTYWRAREAAQDKYEASLLRIGDDVVKRTDEAAEMAKRMGDAFSSTFDRAFRDGMKFGDLLKKLAFDAINIQFLTPAAQKAGSMLGTAATALFKSFDGGGYTGSAARSGGLDGKGGFMAMLHPNETVIDHTRGQSAGGSTIVQNISIDARGADAGVEQRIRAAMAQTKSETLAAVQARANRGGSFAAALGRA
jgi:hypothetical protein